ncbi:MAG: succinyl-diaminopimelate desuccinylase [Zetaproteobacteria bacterium CG12_big_fil_rev_8_21_14_0_65_54_13]|nr:MAG: succinyl-diaminopimelate desuccinylase [Zetaproteobacteria bacterium CG23_combo_of_CG06-09_8_20_14_all_54_7]PIW45153.1 MAG: succinyl-diaminopimelate desuccinylase [Zetaproteobacteria bacterium CG12_big_fil_rev_8_21_14_0_65_54_13]PIX55603.1 MAG: succinyl-diaminopimelate desuccinylase [Zetaproteobacteria bacterium CG_4_10_14_3_um_filter_54_28]PJA27729.1 MAG: succinyl-diaminopimelate desuccinylase [Zetaproteobacteria bacterium CG_4_9_14_3_um_filter_54_145]
MPDIATNIAVKLIQRESVTPEDGGCQNYMESLLAPLGFVRTAVDTAGITNSIYTRGGELPGTIAFAGHTDVVPTGPVEQWQHAPFSASIIDGILHGRGAQDMKGAIACWIAAVAGLCADYTPLPTIQLLITSDEEGDSIDGTIRIVEYMQAKGSLPDAAIIGEPSCDKLVGDTIRRGRRGVIQVRATIHGKQGHSAYPQDADNAIHRAAPALTRIAAIDWGEAAAGFPGTSCQITNISGGTGASNVIPGHCDAFIDIRYNPGNSFEQIKAMIESACSDCETTLDFDHVATAFSTPDGYFLDLISDSIQRATGIDTLRDTGGGTSDGRFLAAAGIPVAELGTTNSTIHQVDEQVAVSELATLTAIYSDIIKHFEVRA